MSELCACGRPAVRWCDACIGCGPRLVPPGPHDAAGPPPEPMWVLDLEVVHTCDAPLCEACARQVGHMCGHAEDGAPWSDSIDRCPVHAERDPPVEILRFGEVEVTRARIAAELAGTGQVIPWPGR